MKGEIVALQNDQHTVVENYIEVHSIHTNMKTSLIPIIGKGLTYLAGTATESDLNTIYSSVRKSQEEIANVVDENILVINITRVEMSENIQALNKINGSIANLDAKLGNITQALEKGCFKLDNLYNYIYN